MASTAVGAADTAKEFEVAYGREKKIYTVRAKSVVMACWNGMIPHLCTELPAAQKEALKYGVKVPLVYTSVALKNWTAFKKLGISGDAAAAYAREVVAADFEEAGDGDVLRKVSGDLSAKGIAVTEAQVRAILDLRLHRLTALGRDEIAGELRTLAASISGLLEILADRVKLYAVMREEFEEILTLYATPRMSEIAPAWDGIEDEALIEREDMVVTVTLGGYIKRTPLETFRTQARGGKGRSGMSTKEEDAVVRVFAASTHAPVLFFSSEGKVYTLKVWRLPVGLPNSRGKAFINLLPLVSVPP